MVLFNLNSSNVIVKNVSLFLLSNKDSIIGNKFIYFLYKYKLYISNWFSKLRTLMKCIYVVSSNSTLKYCQFIRDLCWIQDYSSTCILTSAELSFWLNIYALYKAFIFQTIIIFICHIVIIICIYINIYTLFHDSRNHNHEILTWIRVLILGLSSRYYMHSK